MDKVNIKPQYEVVGYQRKEEGEVRKTVKIQDWAINFYVDSIKEAQELAVLAKLKSYGVLELIPNDRGEIWRGSDDQSLERVFVTPDVLKWEAEVKAQTKAYESKREKAAELINALPMAVKLWHKDGVLIEATRGEASPTGYSGMNINFAVTTIRYKKEIIGYWDSYVIQGYLSDTVKSIQGKRLAQDIYRRTNPYNFRNAMSAYDAELKAIPQDKINECKNILLKAVTELKELNAQIQAIKADM